MVRKRDIKALKNTWKCQVQGEGGRVGEGIGLLFQIFDGCESNNNEQRFIIKSWLRDIIEYEMSK